MNTENDKYKYIKYNDYWQNSLQKLEIITKDLKKKFFKLEKQYFNFDNIYNEIITEIDILSSIYAGHNNLKGKEYVLMLKALLQNYKKRYTHEGISFKTIDFLNSKINKLRELSFGEFPKMENSYSIYKEFSDNGKNTTIDRNVKRYNYLKSGAKNKWVTFQRNRSWFITPYNRLNIVKAEEAKILKDIDTTIKINYENTAIPVIDKFSQFARDKREQLKYFLITENKNKYTCFAVYKFGRIILANKDFIFPRLKAFEESKISSGRFRIFGKNHIYL